MCEWQLCELNLSVSNDRKCADLCRSSISIAVIPPEIVEFSDASLAGDRERVMSTQYS